jgi:hypothetical protein
MKYRYEIWGNGVCSERYSTKKEAKECLAALLADDYNAYLVDQKTGKEIQVTNVEIEVAKNKPRKSIFG